MSGWKNPNDDFSEPEQDKIYWAVTHGYTLIEVTYQRHPLGYKTFFDNEGFEQPMCMCMAYIEKPEWFK